jgi:hypothetical protein
LNLIDNKKNLQEPILEKTVTIKATTNSALEERVPFIHEEPSFFETFYAISKDKTRPASDQYRDMLTYSVNRILDSGYDITSRDGAVTGVSRYALAKLISLAGGIGYLAIRTVEALDHVSFEFSHDRQSGLLVAFSELDNHGTSRLIEIGKAIMLASALTLADAVKKPPKQFSLSRHGEMNQLKPARSFALLTDPILDGLLTLIPFAGAANIFYKAGLLSTSASPSLVLSTGALVPVASTVEITHPLSASAGLAGAGVMAMSSERPLSDKPNQEQDQRRALALSKPPFRIPTGWRKVGTSAEVVRVSDSLVIIRRRYVRPNGDEMIIERELYKDNEYSVQKHISVDGQDIAFNEQMSQGWKLTYTDGTDSVGFRVYLRRDGRLYYDHSPIELKIDIPRDIRLDTKLFIPKNFPVLNAQSDVPELMKGMLDNIHQTIRKTQQTDRAFRHLNTLKTELSNYLDKVTT